jgi:hypothetical protein
MYRDLENLNKQEIESLISLLKNKIDMVTDCYEKMVFYESKELYMQMKEFQFKYKDGGSKRV